MPPQTRNGEGPCKGKGPTMQPVLVQGPPPQQRRLGGRSPTVQSVSQFRGLTMPSLHNIMPPEQPHRSNEHARRGDKSVTKLREKSARGGPQSHHQVNPDEGEDPRLDELQEKRRAQSPLHGCSHASGPPPRHSQAPPGHGWDLRHVLDDKRRDRIHREEDSSSSHEHVEPKKQWRIPEDDEELKQWINRQVKLTVRQNMETAGIARDQCSAFEAEDTGASPFSREIRKYSLPKKFNVPRFTLYDGTLDPAAHLRHYVQRMSVWGENDFLNCRGFSSSLGDLPLRWFCSLLGGSISSWGQLRTSFLEKFPAHRIIPKIDADLMALRMREDENVTHWLCARASSSGHSWSCTP
ncbi:hypothetical protein AAC387_Pa09g1601 [Persea americana]